MGKLFIDQTRNYFVFACPKDGEVDIVYTEDLEKPIGAYIHSDCKVESNLIELDWTF
jgi:hypothetical protein